MNSCWGMQSYFDLCIGSVKFCRCWCWFELCVQCCALWSTLMQRPHHLRKFLRIYCISDAGRCLLWSDMMDLHSLTCSLTSFDLSHRLLWLEHRHWRPPHDIFAQKRFNFIWLRQSWFSKSNWCDMCSLYSRLIISQSCSVQSNWGDFTRKLREY